MKRQIALIAALTVALSAAPAFAKATKFDPYSDGAKSGKFDTFTDGAKAGKFDSFTDGAKSFDVYTEGTKI